MPVTVRLIAEFVAKPERAEDLRELLVSLIETTRAEQGCVRYDLWRSQEQANVFAFVEEWESEADLQKHLAAPHLQHAVGQLDELLEQPLALRRFDLAG